MIQPTGRDAGQNFDSTSLGDWPGIVVALPTALDPSQALQRLAALPHCVFFDSAQQPGTLGRYSFIAADPFDWLIAQSDDALTWQSLNRQQRQFFAPTLPELPPFQGGMAGVLAYDLSRNLERLPPPRYDEFQFPGIAVGTYDTVIAFDHQTGGAWIVSQGFPELEPLRRQRRARLRATQFADLLSKSQPPPPWRDDRDVPDIRFDQLDKQHQVGTFAGLTSNFNQQKYLQTVQRAIEYVFAGDVFQVNLAQRLLYPAREDPLALYLRLRQCNPAPFAGYFDLGAFQILSTSPERFLQVTNRQVETRPIKGTRWRAPDADAADHAAAELNASEKDRAENVMIVDLLRNDLSRVCRPESVQVSELCRLERYAFVQHLVSVVHGALRDHCGPLELLQAAFPGGSVTGAPKVRAMQIIAELEPTARGAYCGSLAYIGFDGAMDSSILIRTITAGRGWWQFPVGGGIVAQSDPESEYVETWHKAEGILRGLLP